MYRVVLVDDERLILEGLSKVVNWQSMGCMVAGTAADGMEGLRLIRELLPHIVLTDIRMPNMDGLTMLAALRSEFPQMQVTVLTAYRDFDYAQKAINLGVCRYLLKPYGRDQRGHPHHGQAAGSGRAVFAKRGGIAPAKRG